MIKKLLSFSILVFFTGFLASCESSTTPPSTPIDTTIVSTHDRALFVVNEGVFGKGNSSLDVVIFHKTLSIHDSASKSDTTVKIDTIIHSDVVKNMGLGNDIVVAGNKSYILDNGSNALNVVDADSLKSTASISFGLDGPNKMARIGNNLLLITKRSATSAAIFDVTTNSVVDSIAIGEPSIAVAVLNGKAYVTSGATSYGPPFHLNVVDLATRKVTKTIPLSGAPEQAIADSTGNQIIIGAPGDYVSFIPHFYFVNVTTDVVQDSLTMGDPTSDGELIAGAKMFMIIGTDVYRLDGTTHKLGATVFQGTTPLYRGYYDAATDELVLGVYDFTSGSGKVNVYNASSGAFKWSFPTGIAPAHFAFYH